MKYLLKKIPEISALSPYVEQEVVLRTSHGVAGIVLQGVLPNDSLALALKRIVKGSTLLANSDSIPQIILSKGIAKDLGTDVGKNVTALRFHEGMQKIGRASCRERV